MTHQSDRFRRAGLPAVALGLVGGVLAVQLANGGGRFAPLRPADPCAPRSVTSTAASPAEGIEGLIERLVLSGMDRAACRLHVSREALTLDLARSGTRADSEIGALRRGLLSAVREMEDDGSLPPASELVDDALDSLDLNGLLKVALRAIPDSVIDAGLKTDDVLTRTIDGLDLRTLLANLDSRHDLDEQIQAAVTRAVEDSLAARLRDLL